MCSEKPGYGGGVQLTRWIRTLGGTGGGWRATTGLLRMATTPETIEATPGSTSQLGHPQSKAGPGWCSAWGALGADSAAW